MNAGFAPPGAAVANASLHTLAAAGISVTLDLSVGHIHRFQVTRDGKTIAPLHRAPWADDPAMSTDPSIAPNVRRLSGDFFCAPFGLSDVEPAPTHGWPANSSWRLLDESIDSDDRTTARFQLDRPVMGARLVKELTLRDGHPFLYQRHVFHGGSGGITAAHHVMVALPDGGRLRFSQKAYADLPPIALEPDPARGRSILRYPSRTEDLGAIPLADGRMADLHHYPFAERHEDFFMLVEAPENQIGWTVVERAAEAVVILKNPACLPVTLLWMSNGGRDYPPWNGRHTRVIGIEDARCWSLFGHAASVADNPLRRSGIPTAFELEPQRAVEVRHVIGALPLPAGWAACTSLFADGDTLRIADGCGGSLAVPYDPTFLAAAVQA